MKLSDEAKETAGYYKVIQSSEFGIDFGLVLAQRVLAQCYPDRVVSIVPADTALVAGWKALGKYRPQFFAELWKPGEPSLVLPIACKGNHGNVRDSHGQLASASAHLERVHIGPWNETPALIFSTELPLDGYVTVHALRAPGSGGWVSKPSAESGGLDVELADENFLPGIQLPAEDKSPVPRSPDSTSRRNGTNGSRGCSRAPPRWTDDLRRRRQTDHAVLDRPSREKALQRAPEKRTGGAIPAGHLRPVRRWGQHVLGRQMGGPVSIHSAGTALAIRRLP